MTRISRPPSSATRTAASARPLILDSSVVIDTERCRATLERLIERAVALSLGYSVLTANVPHFRQAPGLSVVLFRQPPSVTLRFHVFSRSSFLTDDIHLRPAPAHRGRPSRRIRSADRPSR
jgi:hypothetical protein